MKKETGIALGVAALVGAYFLNQKLNPPSLIINHKDYSKKSAEIVFDGTPATVSTSTVVTIPGRNNTSLKAYGEQGGSMITMDLYKNGKYVSKLNEILFG